MPTRLFAWACSAARATACPANSVLGMPPTQAPVTEALLARARPRGAPIAALHKPRTHRKGLHRPRARPRISLRTICRTR